MLDDAVVSLGRDPSVAFGSEVMGVLPEPLVSRTATRNLCPVGQRLIAHPASRGSFRPGQVCVTGWCGGSARRREGRNPLLKPRRTDFDDPTHMLTFS